MKSFYADYIKEREGLIMFETAIGFVTMKHLDQDAVYVVETYLAPDYRKKGLAKQLVDDAINSLEKRPKQLITTCQPGMPSCGDSMRAILAYGFEPVSVNGLMVCFRKEL